jgi:hypothetical protein
MRPTEEDAQPKPPAFMVHIAGFIAGAFLIMVVMSLIDGRPFSPDRSIDFLAMALLAGGAGACAALGRFLLSPLLAPTVPAEDLSPEARSLRRQYRAVFWFGATLTFFFAGLLMLLALSIGTGHAEWVSWMPNLPRRRGLLDLLLR